MYVLFTYIILVYFHARCFLIFLTNFVLMSFCILYAFQLIAVDFDTMNSDDGMGFMPPPPEQNSEVTSSTSSEVSDSRLQE